MIRYDERCSACYLGHGHDEREHWLAVAMMQVWGRRVGPHVSRFEPCVTDWMAAFLAENAPLAFARDEIETYACRPVR